MATSSPIPTAARGIDIQKALSSIPWVAWVTAATGILVYWYIQSTQGVITSTLFIL